MFKPNFLVTLGVIAVLSGCASTTPLSQSTDGSGQISTAITAPLEYETYATILQTYVNEEGLVDYLALQANAQPLKDVVAQLGAVSSASYESWSEADQIAFLINAYNIITLDSIINQDPLKDSIKDIPGVWKFQTHTVMGKSLTLDNLEHDILRKDFVEPRIHAALVCAAISCPPLRREPYNGEALDVQLEDQVQIWMDSPIGLKIDRAQNQVSISAIFDWFGQDWQPQYGVESGFTGNEKQRATLNFISNYVSPEDRTFLMEGDYSLNYLHYDWSLNQQ